MKEHDYTIADKICRWWEIFSGCGGCQLSCCIYKDGQPGKKGNVGARVMKAEEKLLKKKGISQIEEVDGILYLKTKDDGKCVFYEKGLCKQYKNRPIICRTHPFIWTGTTVGLGALCQNVMSKIPAIIADDHDEVGILKRVMELFLELSDDVRQELESNTKKNKVTVSVDLRSKV
jgi:Fe-S-cluster containining protein